MQLDTQTGLAEEERMPVAAPVAPMLRESYFFEWKKASLGPDLILIVAIAICLGTGLAAGHAAAGMIAAGGAMTVGFGVKQSIDDSFLLPMIFGALGITFSTYVGMVAGHTNMVLVPLAAAWGLGYGMLSNRESGFNWVGQQCVVFLLVASAFPFSARAAAVRASLILAGAAVQILSVSVGRRVLPQLYADLRAVARYVRAEEALLRETMLSAVRSLWPGQSMHSAVPYAIRLAILLAVSTEIYRRLNFSSGYWIPMTALLVLKPGPLTDTASRAIARTVGTLAGAILASYLIVHLPMPALALAGFTLLFAWLSYGLLNVNYALFSVVLTAYIVFLLSLNNVPGAEIAHRRAICTVIGGGLALAVRLLVIRLRFFRAPAVARHA